MKVKLSGHPLKRRDNGKPDAFTVISTEVEIENTDTALVAAVKEFARQWRLKKVIAEKA